MAASSDVAANAHVSDGAVSLQEKVQEVAGVPACPPDANEEVVELLTLILFLLITHPSNQDTVTNEARKKTLRNAVSDGNLNEDLDEISINTMASSGFSASTSNNGVECRICLKQVLNDKLKQMRENRCLRSLLTNHSKNCLFLLMCSSITNSQLRREEPFLSLFNHLRQQWTTTKASVASEMGYSAELILVTMSQQFQLHGVGFSQAGALIDAALDLELEKRPALGWDVSVFLKRLTASVRPRLAVSRPVGKGPSSRHVVEPVKDSAPMRAPLHRQASNSTSNNFEQAGSPMPALGARPSSGSLREETLKMVYRWRCKACGKQDADQLLMDCGHLALCSPCREIHSSCPICKVPILLAPIRVYAS